MLLPLTREWLHEMSKKSENDMIMTDSAIDISSYKR